MDVALATCVNLPEPDPDAAPLADALARAGIEASTVAWDDADVDWSRARLTVLRSTWNYPLRPDAFIGWAERVADVSELWNPIDIVRWNVHKKYLLDLESRGIPIAPTVLLPRGDSASLAEVMEARGWDEVVVKPAISAASFRTVRVGPEGRAAGEAHLRALVADRDALVQRYLSGVEDHGERALIWIDGTLTHAVRKSPRFSGEDESVSPSAVPVAPEEAALARRVLAGLERRVLYARVDVAPGPDGRPVVMELELIEPSLFLRQGPQALERLVAALGRRLGR